MALELNGKLDVAAAAKEYKKAGRVRVTGVLDDASADELFAVIRDTCTWRWTYREGSALTSISGQELNAKTERRKREFNDKIYSQARKQSQHFYFICPLTFSRTGEQPGPLADADALFKSDVFRDLIRQITGHKEGELVDPHARWFNRDMFETDNIDFMNESANAAMFDLGLAKDWRNDWGGHLNFLDDDGGFEETWAAGFNVLDVVALPSRRSTSYVPPFMSSFHLGVMGELS